MPPKRIFREGERVLCFRGPLIYDAKCLKVSTTRRKVKRYFIQYIGQDQWADEWVTEDRVIKFNEATLRRQKQLQSQHAAQPTEPETTSANSSATEAAASSASVQEDTVTTTLATLPKRPKVVKSKRFTRSQKGPLPSTSAGPTGDRDQVGPRRSSRIKEEPMPSTSAGPSQNFESVAGTSSASVKVEVKTSPSPAPVNEELMFNMATTSTAMKHSVDDADNDSDGNANGANRERRVVGRENNNTPISTYSNMSELTINFEEVSLEETIESMTRKFRTGIKFPQMLKEFIAFDYLLITTENMLSKIPARYTVAQLIENYLAFRRVRGVNHTLQMDTDLIDLLGKLKEYFNKVLRCQLLYNVERLQHHAALEDYPGTPECRLYGVIHLMRLFTKLQPFVACITLATDSYDHIGHLEHFMKFLLKNRMIWWQMSDYKTVGDTPAPKSNKPYRHGTLPAACKTLP